MHVVTRGPAIEVLAPAKLNLFLEVIARRDDGFHEVASFMTAIDLCDELRFQTNSKGDIQLDCEWTNGWEARRRRLSTRDGSDGSGGALPSGTDNLVVRALQHLKQRTGVSGGMTVRVVKRIPAAAGLGGASSNAAAALLAGNHLWNVGLSQAELAEVAADLGSDIPFFLFGGSAVCLGRGEQIQPVAGCAPLYFAVAKPAAGLSTPAVYRRCRPAGPAARSVEPLLTASRSGHPAAVAACLVNRLEPAARQLCPAVEECRKMFLQAGCVGQQMSGSGTSYFGICHNPRHARRVAATLRAAGCPQAFAVRSLPSGSRAYQVLRANRP